MNSSLTSQQRVDLALEQRRRIAELRARALAANVAQDSTQFDLFVGGDLHEAEKELSRFEAGIDAAYALARAKDMITGSTNNYAYYFENGLSPTHLPHFAMPV